MSGKESTPRDLNKSTVTELREELSSRGLPTSGVKKDLIERLLEDYKCEQAEQMHQEDEPVPDPEGEEGEGHEPEKIEGEREPGEEEVEDHEEHMEEGHDINGEEHGDHEDREIQSDDELDEVLGGEAREAFEEGMRGEEYEEEEQYVTLDKYDDKEDVPPEASQDEEGKNGEEESKPKEEEDGEDKEKPKETAEKVEEEKLPMPPNEVHKWVFKQTSVAKKYSSLYVSELTAKDVICPAIVEWANRAVFFCVNHSRDGKGTVMLNFASDKECKESKEALTVSLGEAVKVVYPSISLEDEIRSGLTYKFDSSHPLGQRVITIEDFPPNTTEDQINSLFPEAIMAFRPDITTQVQNWQSDDYILPENLGKMFFVEFAHTKAAAKAIPDEDKPFELEGQKLKVQLLCDYEETYKKKYVKELNEAREKKWEELDKKKKETMSESFSLTDQERLQLYRDLEDAVNKRAKLTRNPHITWEEKMLKKQNLTSTVFDIVRKIDSDADRRIKEELKFPEHSRIMTKHTKNEFTKLAPHQRGTFGGGKDSAGSDWKPRGRGTYRSSVPKSYSFSSSYDSYRGRGRGRGAIRGRGRGSSYDYRRESSDRPGFRDGHYQDTKRRRTDDYEHGRRKEDPSVVTSALKSLTEVLSTKMDEMSRIAGGMKARERELHEAVDSVKRRGGPTSYSAAPKRRYESDSYSSSQPHRASNSRYYSSADASHSRYSTGDSYSSSSRYPADSYSRGRGSASYSSSGGRGGGSSSYYSSTTKGRSSYSGASTSDKYSSHRGSSSYHSSSSSRRGSRGGYSKY